MSTRAFIGNLVVRHHGASDTSDAPGRAHQGRSEAALARRQPSNLEARAAMGNMAQ